MMGPLAAVGAGLGIISSIYGIGSGIAQMREARKMLRQAMPKYQIPEEAKQALAGRQMYLNARSPQGLNAEQAILANQAATTFNARQAAPSASTMLGVLGTTQANTNQALIANAAQEGAQFEQRLAGLEAQQGNMAAQRERQFMLNQYMPAQQNRQFAQQQLNAGRQNIMGGITRLSGQAGQLYDMEAENQTLSHLYGSMFQGRAPQLGASGLDAQGQMAMRARLNSIINAPLNQNYIATNLLRF